jgi:hypothetical protein
LPGSVLVNHKQLADTTPRHALRAEK